MSKSELHLICSNCCLMKTSTNCNNLMHHCKMPKLWNSPSSFHMFAIRITSCLVVRQELGFVADHNLVTSHNDCWPQNVPSWCGWIWSDDFPKYEGSKIPKMLVPTHQSIQHYIWEDQNLHQHHCENCNTQICLVSFVQTELCCFTIRTIIDGHSFGV